MLDYGNSTFIGIPCYNIAKLQSIQNISCWIMFWLHKRTHITQAMYQLHLPCIDERIAYKIAVILFKCIHDMSSKYLQDLAIRSHNRQLRLHTANKMPMIGTHTDITQNGSFSSVWPHTWNSFSGYLSTRKSLDLFKKNLKTSFI